MNADMIITQTSDIQILSFLECDALKMKNTFIFVFCDGTTVVGNDIFVFQIVQSQCFQLIAYGIIASACGRDKSYTCLFSTLDGFDVFF